MKWLIIGFLPLFSALITLAIAVVDKTTLGSGIAGRGDVVLRPGR